jgi:hypothetical protein
MKTTTTIILTALIVGFISFCAGIILPGAMVPFVPSNQHALEEFKMCYWNLTFNDSSLTPQTKEYLKDRLYWNAVVHIKPNSFPNYRFDFGPVDVSLLGTARGRKDCSSALEVYEDAMKIHGQKGKHPTIKVLPTTAPPGDRP